MLANCGEYGIKIDVVVSCKRSALVARALSNKAKLQPKRNFDDKKGGDSVRVMNEER